MRKMVNKRIARRVKTTSTAITEATNGMMPGLASGRTCVMDSITMLDIVTLLLTGIGILNERIS